MCAVLFAVIDDVCDPMRKQRTAGISRECFEILVQSRVSELIQQRGIPLTPKPLSRVGARGADVHDW
jgi:hypothetical protein